MRRWLFDQLVVAAHDIFVIVVAGDQDDGMNVAIGKDSVGSNFAAVIDGKVMFSSEAGVISVFRLTGGSPFSHKTAAPSLPQSCGGGVADDLAFRVDDQCFAAAVAGEQPDIDHLPVFPENRVSPTKKIGIADDLALVINPRGDRKGLPGKVPRSSCRFSCPKQTHGLFDLQPGLNCRQPGPGRS